MIFNSKTFKSWISLFILVCFIGQLALPTAIYAKDSSKPAENSERIDKKFLTRISQRIKVILEKVCEKISANPDNDIRINTYLVDKRHRVFTDIEGSIVIRFPSIMKSAIQKFKDTVGKCMTTNGSLGIDFAVQGFEKIDKKSYRLTFRVDLIMPLKEILRHMFVGALDLFGTITIGTSVAKASSFLDSVSTENLALSIGEGLKRLWALGAGKIAVDSYREFDETGSVHFKTLLARTFTLRSFIYHFGAFIIKAGIDTGKSLTNLSIGAAIGTSLAGQAGAFIGAVLATAAISIIGSILVKKLTIDFPMKYRLRKIRKLRDKIDICFENDPNDSGTYVNSLIDELEKTELAAMGFLKDEIAMDRYTAFNVFVEKMKDALENGKLHYYEELILKVKNELQISAVHDENWNAARYYYQLLKAIDQLPARAE